MFYVFSFLLGLYVRVGDKDGLVVRQPARDDRASVTLAS